MDLAENGSATVLRPSRIGALPGQVDPDVFSTIQFLPGINAPNGDASGLYVRGGASDQNLILWEGIPIYHAAHFFGMISAFNPYIIDKVKVYRGGFGSSYGGRISSVIELESPEQEPTGTRFGAGLNFVNAYAHGAVGLGERATAVFSVRRSISELWRSPTFNNIALRNQQSLLQVGFDFNNIPTNFEIKDDFRFWEGHGKLIFNLSEKDNLNVSYFFNDNNFDDLIIDPLKKQEQTDKLDLISNGGSATWERNWSRNYSTKILTSFSKYDYDYVYDIHSFGMGQQPDRNGQKNNKVIESQILFSNEYKIQSHHSLNFGYQFTNYDVDYRILHAKEGIGILEDQKESYDSGVHAFFGEFKSSEKNKFGIDAGARLSWFQLKNKYYLSPRFKAWYNLTEHINLNFNVGKYRQFISQLVEFKGDNLGFSTPVWVLNGNNEAPVLDATQLQAGIIFNKNGWVIDLQAYQKMTNGLTSLAIGFDVDTRKPESGESSQKGLIYW